MKRNVDRSLDRLLWPAAGATSVENRGTMRSKMNTIFVGNLSANLTPDELRILFQTYGVVEGVEIVTDVDTRYSRGFAFVEMASGLEASKAIAELNGTTAWGKVLKVEEAELRFQPSKATSIKERRIPRCRE
jgi:RNA recognition motif-containing protein